MTVHDEHSCCSPAGRFAGDDGLVAEAAGAGQTRAGTVAEDRHRVVQARVPATVFAMGDAQGDGKWGDGETPVHEVSLSAFSIDATSVTNEDFAQFVDATGYRTDAETFGYSAVFHLALAAEDDDVLGQPPQTPWWLGVRGADWRHPGGPRSDADGLDDHPVVHVSWNDAVAYCDWADRSLPTEAQWEAASRGGLPGARYPWGNDLGAADGDPVGWRTNIFQGSFPGVNTLDDGFLTTAPVRSFEQNGYGLWQTVGNVWEWCSDVFDARTYAVDAERGRVHDPSGPGASTPGAPRVMRGGSYLCHDSYCNRYRNAARSQNTPESSMGNTGFRTVARAEPRPRGGDGV